jgi:asparagine synthetase B (glutamine-hydrolysing)
MLDDAVRAATCALPGDLKVRPRGLGFDTKWPLREAMRARLPAQLVDRPKRSLPSPLDGFLRVGLGRDWMQGALSAMRADASGLFAPAALQRLEAAHLSGQANHGLKLWTLLLFHEWWSQLHEP